MFINKYGGIILDSSQVPAAVVTIKGESSRLEGLQLDIAKVELSSDWYCFFIVVISVDLLLIDRNTFL